PPLAPCTTLFRSLFAALWMIGRRLGADTRSITILIVINFVLSFTASGISWQGHLGGFLTGLAASAPVVLADKQRAAAGSSPETRKRANRRTWLGLALVAVVLVILTVIGGLLINTETVLGG